MVRLYLRGHLCMVRRELLGKCFYCHCEGRLPPSRPHRVVTRRVHVSQQGQVFAFVSDISGVYLPDSLVYLGQYGLFSAIPETFSDWC